MRLNVFRGARGKTPIAQDDYTWSELVDVLEEMCGDEAEPGPTKARKLSLLAVTFGPMREAYNCDANVEHLDALAIDVDKCDVGALTVPCAAFMYASPSDPNPDGSRRVRVVTPLSAPLAPEHVKHARHAFAELLGLAPGCGVENADAVSQVMFTGRLHGTPARETWRFDGEPLDTAALIAHELVHAWPAKVRKAKASAAAAPDTRFDADPDERTQALLVALEPYWEAPGEATGRRGVLRALGGYLARRGWPNDQIVAVARGLDTERPERLRAATMLECAREARTSTSSAGWSALVSWNAAAADAIENAAKDPREPADWPGVWSEWWARYLDRRASNVRVSEPSVSNGQAPEPDTDTDTDTDTFTPAADAPDVPLFLRSRNGHVTLIWEGDERGHQPIADKIIRTRLLELGYADSLVQMRVKGKSVPVDAILEAHSESYTRTAYSFRERVTKYDPSGGGSVLVGFPSARGVWARFDVDADAWLRALGGSHYDRLAVWIASCTQPNIDRLAACVVLMGRADSGKSMFGHAVAGLWGDTPCDMGLVTVTFNADLARCPILADEEAKLFGSKELSTKRFREMVQEGAKSIELKGKERCQLVGAMRGVVSCNGYSDLRFSDLGGPAVVEALRDRMLVIDCTARTDACKAPLERLRARRGAALAAEGRAPDYKIDLASVTGHMAWLAETTALPAERFLGAGGDGSESAIMAGHTHETAELWDTLQDWIDGSADGPWYASERFGLCVDTRALAAALESSGRGWDLPRVNAALAPFATGKHRLGGSARTRTVGLDAARVAGALDLDDESVAVLMGKLSDAHEPTTVAGGGLRGKFR